ncbi:Transmembrane protein 35A [Amphibalanus amphitrite]|uniref:Novel acetylcholine receptor chaperone n=1 Tax=Amphibalanus amphitrite TaxID=1232801 RepID=A0A6A4WSH6_AMPAM|nr:novel acetylcholine receptor chaperone-like [Amphibalanus amphitrite]XP_043243893.1 novel acetylcholine receptor chaperone-like [Amphibalanus amphitrite]KAF0306640.1 Transmembrane protein 35A [Amphibalanus amphitrite]
MASLVLKTLSIFLGLFFIFVGLTKITPKINAELHRELKREFVKYSKVIPFVKAYNIKIHSKQYRSFVGGLEISCGACLAFIPFKRMKQTANCLLLIMMLFTMYTHYAVGDRFERTAPSLVFLFMLVCRLIVDYQVQRQERAAADKTAPSAASATAAATAAGDGKSKKTE